jgi:serine/threonine-protein kinase
LTPELWERVCRAFDRAGELAGESRAEFLSRLRDQDAEAAAAVEGMLRRQGAPALLSQLPTHFWEMLDVTEPSTGPQVDGSAEWPDQIGPYKVQGELGKGGMSVVLQARDPKFDRLLAIKLVKTGHAGDELARRFRQEAILMGRLQHPGIPPVHDWGELPDGRPYLAMKLIKGRTLAELLRDKEIVNDKGRLLTIFEHICHTIAYAHARKVIHRDLKPGNIMVGAHGEVQVMDWGLAKPAPAREEIVPASVLLPPSSGNEEDTIPGAVMGTVAYMAPEQARGEVDSLDERCDVFGLGAILCVVLTGNPPFDRIDRARQGDLAETFQRLDECGGDLELIALAKGCLAPDRENRPRDAGQVAATVACYQAALQQRLRDAEIHTARAQVRAQEERKRRRIAWTLAAVIVVFVFLGAWYYREREEIARAARRHNVESEFRKAVKAEEQIAVELRQMLADYNRVHALLSDLDDWKDRLDKRKDHIGDEIALLSAGDPGLVGSELRALLDKQNERFEEDTRHFNLAKELDDIHLESFTFLDTKSNAGPKEKQPAKDTGEQQLNPTAAAPKYAAFFFKQLKIDVEAGVPDQIAAQIRESPLHHVLVSALDHWAAVTQDPASTYKPVTAKLLHIARLADADPWRDRFRRPSVWGDRLKLEQLATEMEPVQQSPQILIALAGQLEQCSSGGGRAVLDQALLAYPHDFWLNLTMANQSKFSDVRAGYYHAALAVRQQNSVAWNNLAAALYRQRKVEEALAACRKAASFNAKDWNPHRLAGKIFLFRGLFEDAEKTSRKALDLLPADHPFYAEVADEWNECQRCLDVQQKEKLQNVLKTLGPAGTSGRLSSADPLDLFLGNRNSPRKSHALELKAGKSYQLDLRANEFDPILRIETSDWKPLVSNDDVCPPSDLNSRLVFTPQRDGVYRLVVNSFVRSGEPKKINGAYDLQLREVRPTGPAKLFEGELHSRTDATGKFSREHPVDLPEAIPYVFELHSQRFDTYLRLRDASGKIIVYNDDMAPGNIHASRIDFTPARPGTFVLEVTSYYPGETGPYTLSVQGYRPHK